MSTRYAAVLSDLQASPKRWLVTGVAGFIGSHLLERLLSLGQEVVGLDNFATGSQSNLDSVHRVVGEQAYERFRFIEGDICDPRACQTAVKGVDYVLHQAALGSVPRSIKDPQTSNRVNVGGFVEMLSAAEKADVRRFVYASSSSVYGDVASLRKQENVIGKPLSPYAATKRANEIYADAFSSVYGIQIVGLRYFNVFGPRQNPDGPYAAVVPRWIQAISEGKAGVIFGDGETTRDFCYVGNVVQANILSACAPVPLEANIFNVAVGQTTNLNTLYELLSSTYSRLAGKPRSPAPTHEPFRAGDVRQSLADVELGQKLLGYEAGFDLEAGVELLISQSLRTPR